jgi:hypothetical protein
LAHFLRPSFSPSPISSHWQLVLVLATLPHLDRQSAKRGGGSLGEGGWQHFPPILAKGFMGRFFRLLCRVQLLGLG